MPLYTYTCGTHGTFKAWNGMATSDEPQPCPTCESLAPRALAAPAIGRNEGDADFDAAGLGMGGGCGEGACGMPDSASMGGHVCGAGCMH